MRIIITVFLVCINLYSAKMLQPVVIPGDESGRCLSQQQRDIARQAIRVAVTDKLTVLLSHQCGAGRWTRVAYLNMSDPTQSCPPAWRDRSANGTRVCGRYDVSSRQCSIGTFYQSGRTYSKVCGQVIGYQIGHPDGFHSQGIDDAYVDGVSITHGSPRSHIWTLTADRYESYTGCPCEGGPIPPIFVGSNYYCESANNGTSQTVDFLHISDPLWDGKQCETEGTCCSTAPWFTVDLVNATSDEIEVRICSNFETEEDTTIHLLELYIQ